jgi:hypothetical protein
MLGRSLLALSLIAALAIAPPVARSRLFCRWTGAEMAHTDCHDGSNADAQAVRADRCCEDRVQAPLPTGKAETTVDASLATPVLVELSWSEVYRPRPSAVAEAPTRLRPPLSETRILLI